VEFQAYIRTLPRHTCDTGKARATCVDLKS